MIIHTTLTRRTKREGEYCNPVTSSRERLSRIYISIYTHFFFDIFVCVPLAQLRDAFGPPPPLARAGKTIDSFGANILLCFFLFFWKGLIADPPPKRLITNTTTARVYIVVVYIPFLDYDRTSFVGVPWAPAALNTQARNCRWPVRPLTLLEGFLSRRLLIYILFKGALSYSLWSILSAFLALIRREREKAKIKFQKNG